MTRALLFQSHLPTHLWEEFLLTCTYLLNRIPSSFLGFISPYEKLYQKPPSYDTIKVFGFLAYISAHTLDKLAPRAIPTVFIGYPNLQKGYKLLDPVIMQFYISRNVIFHEDFSF